MTKPTTGYAIPYIPLKDTNWDALPLASQRMNAVTTKWRVQIRQRSPELLLGALIVWTYNGAHPDQDQIMRALELMARNKTNDGDLKHELLEKMRQSDPEHYAAYIEPYKSLTISTKGES